MLKVGGIDVDFSSFWSLNLERITENGTIIQLLKINCEKIATKWKMHLESGLVFKNAEIIIDLTLFDGLQV